VKYKFVASVLPHNVSWQVVTNVAKECVVSIFTAVKTEASRFSYSLLTSYKSRRYHNLEANQVLKKIKSTKESVVATISGLPGSIIVKNKTCIETRFFRDF
jgi:hypothetical protein